METKLVGLLVGLIVLVAVLIPTTIAIIAAVPSGEQLQFTNMYSTVTNETNSSTVTVPYYFNTTFHPILTGTTPVCVNTSDGAVISNVSVLSATNGNLRVNSGGVAEIGCTYRYTTSFNMESTNTILPLLVLMLAVGSLIFIVRELLGSE